MAKISYLTAMSLVLWLGMSVATWAEESWTECSQRGLGMPQRNEVDDDGKPPTEEDIGALLNVMRGAEIALQADKFQTALVMVAGVAARLNATDLPDHQKAAKFREMLPIIEDAVEQENKAKAIALINTLAEEFKKKDEKKNEENEQGGGVQKRGLLESEDMQRMEHDLRQAFAAIKAEQKEKAEAILSRVYLSLKNNKDFSKQEKALIFLQAIHETEKYVREDAMDKAQQVLEGAAVAMGIQKIQEKIHAGSKVSEEEQEGGDSSSQQKKKEMLQKFLRQAFTAIKEDQREKAEDILSTVYRLLKNDKILSKEEKAIKFIQAIEVTEKYLKEDAMDKAEQVLQGAALGLGIVEGIEQAAKNKKTGTHGTEH